MSCLRRSSILFVSSLLTATAAAQQAPAPLAESARRMKLPEGFTATLFAGEPDVTQPIGFCIDDRGRLWVAEGKTYPHWIKDGSEGPDRILIFEDADGDGRFDTRKIFCDKLANLSGIQVGFGGVWITSVPTLRFIPDRNGDDVPDGPPEVLLDGWIDAQHNVFNGLTWGPDGWLYGCHGITKQSRVGPPGTPDGKRTLVHAGVWRIHPVTRAFEIVANGMTNPWGLDFDDRGRLFASNCVIKHLWHVIPGAHYKRMYGNDPTPNLYRLMESSADHLH